jgi:hypothetical protein
MQHKSEKARNSGFVILTWNIMNYLFVGENWDNQRNGMELSLRETTRSKTRRAPFKNHQLSTSTTSASNTLDPQHLVWQTIKQEPIRVIPTTGRVNWRAFITLRAIKDGYSSGQPTAKVILWRSSIQTRSSTARRYTSESSISSQQCAGALIITFGGRSAKCTFKLSGCTATCLSPTRQW